MKPSERIDEIALKVGVPMFPGTHEMWSQIEAIKKYLDEHHNGGEGK